MSVVVRGVKNNKTPVLFFNGIGMNSGPWRELMAKMNRTTIAFNVPTRSIFGGFGSWHNTEMEYIASLVDEMLLALGYSQVDVVGVSWGGMLAQVFARPHASSRRPKPTKVRRLVLAATLTGWKSKLAPAHILMAAKRLRRADTPESRIQLSQSVYAGALIEHPDKSSLLPGDNPPSDRDYNYRLAAMQGLNSQPWLKELRMPTLVLSGEGDPLVLARNADDLLAGIPNAVPLVIGNGGHLFLFTHQGMPELIEQFFDR